MTTLRQQFLPGRGIGQLSIGLAAVVLILFFMVTGPMLFSETWEKWQNIFTMYLFFVLASLIFAKSAFAISATKWLGIFAASAFGGYLLFSTVMPKYSTGFPTGSVVAILAFSFVVAYSEESLFRATLLEFGGTRMGIGVLGSSIAFAIFHVAAYTGLGLLPFVVAFVSGLAFGFIYLATRSWAGTAIVVGLHLAFNMSLIMGG